MKNIKLSLIGAGPGDPDLITLKGAKALKNADVVLYDALVNRELLKYVPIGVKKIFVGKRSSNHAYSQDEINKLIVKNAFQFGHVVRLKGGDPFVFGRGFEELEYAVENGIESEYIPGISSSISVSGLQNIPVTHRGTSDSFWVITGTKSNGLLADDVYLAPKSNGTVIILMGVNKLQQIVDIYKSEGKNEIAIALIQNGSLPNENFVSGTIETIVDLAKEENIGAPAIIIIGEVVKLRHRLQNKLYELQLLN